MDERIIFLLQQIKNGKKNASVTPSSKFLAKQMLKWIDWEQIDCVIELGAGTWIFTEHIIKYAKPSTKIIVIEIEDVYVNLLQDKFKERIILEKDDVSNIEKIKQKHNIQKIDLIISWLPFLPAESIHKEIQDYTAQGTIFRSFTYQPASFKKKYADFPIRYIGFTFLNVPPARVYGIN
jgi:phospholipid N-methyltransferase